MFQNLHHTATGATSQRVSLAVDRRGGRGTQKRQAQGLCHHTHGIGGELARTGAHGHGTGTLDAMQLLQGNRPSLVATHTLNGGKHRVFSAIG